MCDFKVGDEVVCADAGGSAYEWWGKDVPIEGAAYTVVRVAIVTGIPAVRLMEIENHSVWNGCYASRRFRKVQRRNIQEWLAQSVNDTGKLDKRLKEGAK